MPTKSKSYKRTEIGNLNSKWDCFFICYCIRPIKIKLKIVIYHASNIVLCLFSCLISSVLFIYLMKNDYGFKVLTYMPILSSFLITLILAFPIIKIFKNIRIRNIMMVLFFSALISMGLWYGLLYI